ncbi:hypothetical protein Glove_624g50 [Diversispora epigaea]|uniref:Protein kinase domain-containing protein n=1 Tax=Diversispora epigaea TaxID=1348612 RepID=A0A397GE62_9GLOM|nr:hypothetical protein Glove_624g50 [Diversispora epigaea]
MTSDKMCSECNQEFTNIFKRWCKPYKLIQASQINANGYWKVIEWILYDSLEDIKEIAKCGFGTIYKAKWSNGPIGEWDVENQVWKREGQQNIALKKVDNNFGCLNEDYLNEIAIHLKTGSDSSHASIRIYRITQEPETHKYILWFYNIWMVEILEIT